MSKINKRLSQIAVVIKVNIDFTVLTAAKCACYLIEKDMIEKILKDVEIYFLSKQHASCRIIKNKYLLANMF